MGGTQGTTVATETLGLLLYIGLLEALGYLWCLKDDHDGVSARDNVRCWA